MRVKKVNRYYCDYCKKAGCSSYWIKRHESRCTLNPNRVCGYCKLLEQEQLDITDLIELLPNPCDYDINNGDWIDGGGEFGNLLEKTLPKLREKTGGYPACFMAALRQKGIPVPCAKDFDFKKECKEIWDEVNQRQLMREMRPELLEK